MDFNSSVDRVREEYGVIYLLNGSCVFLKSPKKQEILMTDRNAPIKDLSVDFKLKRSSIGDQLNAYLGSAANWGKKILGIVPAEIL